MNNTSTSINSNAVIELGKAFAFGSAVSFATAAFGLVAAPVAIVGLGIYCIARSDSKSGK